MNFKELTDAQFIEMIVASATIHNISGVTKDADQIAFAERMKVALSNTVKNLEDMDKTTQKLIDANDNLATERSSNKRMRKLLTDFVMVLYEHPSRYPQPLQDLVTRLREEVM